jgi:murein DD-endopeptidase MepM/ murein hydrolase activator NlpD
MDVVLMPEGGGKIRQFRVPLWPVYSVAVAAVFGLIFVVGAGVAYIRLMQVGQENELLYQENEALRTELVSLGGQVDRLDGEVRDQLRLANEARLIAGLPPVSEDIALQGVGGLPAAAGGGAGLRSGVARTTGLYRDRLEQMSRQLAFLEENFHEVTSVIETNKDRLARVPTVNPVMGRCYFSSGFGSRRDPITGGRGFHAGLDICAAMGTPFGATADGVVTFASEQSGLGRTIRVDHGNGFSTVYGHASAILVRKGQSVKRGEVIGKVGNSGRTTGIHLHYEIRQGGRPLNPRTYILADEL